MHDSMPEPVSIDPVVVECDFLQGEAIASIQTAIGSKTPGGATIKAIIVDGYVSEHTVDAALSVRVMLDYGEGEYQTENIGTLLSSQAMVDATMTIIAQAGEIEQSLTYLAEKLPLRCIRQYLRCYFIGTSVIVGIEFLQGWLSSVEIDVFDYPDAISNRCQICTVALPDKESAHEKVEQLSRSSEEWAAFKGAWPSILGDDYWQRIDVADPDFSTYPMAP